MCATRLGRFLMVGMLGIGGVTWLLPSIGAGQAPGRPPEVHPSMPPAPHCRNAMTGEVTRHVGNLLQGPSRPAGLRGIEVQLLDRAGERVARTRTDRDGRFAFRGVCPGTYTVCPGTPCPTGLALPSRYAPATQEVTVPPAVQTGIDFALQEPPPL